ncbi:GNAT family N-acetyltransferase [Virgibacillus halodenitrificans]|uniref:GNAT family N-acetyltransferase n=1 Tax=Virgibacillus halodenitrificans TaxID=1482 RepID=UPI000EF4D388|nr:GNAT family N-acetyltransferase [Virgibacillus halodenitrificans]
MLPKEKIVIRTANTKDAPRILQIEREVVSEESFLITSLEEFDKTVDQQSDWIEKMIHNDRETMLVAEYPGQVVGWIVFMSQNRIRLSHTGSFGMMIEKNFRNMGIGKLLINGILDWAEVNPYIEKVSLGVFSTNKRAIALYKKMGFIEEGRKVREFKISDTEYVDDVLMYKLV